MTVVARAWKGQLGTMTKPQDFQVEGRQSAGFICSFDQRGPADQLSCTDAESQGPWGWSGASRPLEATVHGLDQCWPQPPLPCRVRASRDGDPPVWTWGLPQGCGDSGHGRLWGPGQVLTAAVATGAVSDQYLLWELAPEAPLCPWHELQTHSSGGLQGPFVTWQPQLQPLEMQGLNCPSLNFPGILEPLCFSTCLSLCLPRLFLLRNQKGKMPMRFKIAS